MTLSIHFLLRKRKRFFICACPMIRSWWLVTLNMVHTFLLMSIQVQMVYTSICVSSMICQLKRYGDQLVKFFFFSLEIVDLNDPGQDIELYFKFGIQQFYCNFNLKGEFVLYNIAEYVNFNQNFVWIYSTQTENNKWMCQRFYRISEEAELINISKY